MTECVVVTGMSGAGRSTVSAALDDLGWFIIDNLPLELVVRVGELAAASVAANAGVAFIVGRSGKDEPEALLATVRSLREMHDVVRIVYLDAPDDVLIHRYEGNRRRHPFPGDTLEQSIQEERRLLEPIYQAADVVIDTGASNVNQLRSRITEMFSARSGEDPMRVSIVSFGFSHGLPRDVDVVLDCRFLPNPHWIEELRPQTGLDAPVADYVLGQEQTQHFLRDVVSMLRWQIPLFAQEGKSYLSVAIGCTGGKHRSVAIAEEIRRQLDIHAPVFHRDIQR